MGELCRRPPFPEETVREMVREQLTPEQKIGSGFGPEYLDTRGWG